MKVTIYKVEFDRFDKSITSTQINAKSLGDAVNKTVYDWSAQDDLTDEQMDKMLLVGEIEYRKIGKGKDAVEVYVATDEELLMVFAKSLNEARIGYADYAENNYGY